MNAVGFSSMAATPSGKASAQSKCEPRHRGSLGRGRVIGGPFQAAERNALRALRIAHKVGQSRSDG